MKPSRIHILGGPGSGKSYLGKRLHILLGVPYVNLDRMHYAAASPAQRNAALKKALAGKQYVMEGHWHDWTAQGFAAADTIIFLDVPLWQRELRILGRVVRRTLGIEQGRRYSIKDISEMLRLAREWNRKKALAAIKPYRKKTKVFRSADGALFAMQKQHP